MRMFSNISLLKQEGTSFLIKERLLCSSENCNTSVSSCKMKMMILACNYCEYSGILLKPLIKNGTTSFCRTTCTHKTLKTGSNGINFVHHDLHKTKLRCVSLHAHTLYQKDFVMSTKYLKFYTAFHINKLNSRLSKISLLEPMKLHSFILVWNLLCNTE